MRTGRWRRHLSPRIPPAGLAADVAELERRYRRRAADARVARLLLLVRGEVRAAAAVRAREQAWRQAADDLAALRAARGVAARA